MRRGLDSARSAKTDACVIFVVLLLGVALAAPPVALASERIDQNSPETEPSSASDFIDLHFDDNDIEDAKWAVGRGLAVWHAGKRAFGLLGPPEQITFLWQGGTRVLQKGVDSVSWQPGWGFARLGVYDLETNELIQQVPLNLPADTTWYGASPTLAVDQSSGTLVVQYRRRGRSDVSAVVGEQPTLHDSPPRDPCANLTGCTGGFLLIDAATLEHRPAIDLDGLLLDGVITSPRVLAMRAEEGKLVALLADVTNDTPDTSTSTTPHRVLQSNLHYAMQFDIATARTEWIVRLDGCRGARDPGDDTRAKQTREIANPAAIFRSRAGDAVWVGCHNSSAQTGTVVKVPLDAEGRPYNAPVRVAEPTGEDLPDEPPQPAAPAEQNPSQGTYFGPDNVTMMLADPVSGRLLFRVFDRGGQLVWWVFDTAVQKFIGTIGMGTRLSVVSSLTAFDDVKGRLYDLDTDEGMMAADVRRTPLPQALVYPELASIVPTTGDANGSWQPGVWSDGTQTRIYFGDVRSYQARAMRVVADPIPAVSDPPTLGYEGRTLDIEEMDGVTQAAFDGAARGYGARALLVGGAEAVGRVGPMDPFGEADGVNDQRERLGEGGLAFLQPFVPTVPVACVQANRELVLAFVGPAAPAVVDAAGSRAATQGIVVDSTLRSDAESPVARCAGDLDWDGLWTTALFGRPPVAEPKSEWPFRDEPTDCVSGSERTADSYSEGITGSFASAVECEEQAASGWSHARGFTLDGVTVGQALSSFRVYRDPARGMVSRVESLTRDIQVDGVVRIDQVRAVAESWANGRRQPVPEIERPEDYKPNCDFERTAGTCLVRQIFGMWTPGRQCGPCGDEQRVLDAMNRALGANGVFAFRNPDPALARGSENGYIAGISKPDVERFSDLVLNNDLLQTVLPGLELIRFASPARRLSGQPPRGRQLFQFAGVEATTSYGISCLLVYDEATNTCAASAEPPGSITVSLADADGKPLAGGAFEVRADVDADGVLGLKDALLPNGACVTAEDGVGTCKFEGLKPGGYLVSQVAAPPGYGKSAEPFVVELASGEARTVAFTNVSNLSAVELKATDENGQPLTGATFAAFPDPDSDGKVAPDAKPAAECTTDAQGVCRMQVPAGSYVLVQTAAPAGLEGIEPVPFTFASGGQVAAVTVVNYPPDTPAAPAPEPAPPVYTPAVDVAPPVETVDDTYTPPVDSEPLPETAPGPSLGEKVGGTVVQVVRAPGDAVRLLSRDPKQAVAWTAALALFCLAVIAVRRRQQALALIDR